ncbi:type II toxin-antitoxin system RelE/ParE family toxin [Asticcacaulis sp. AND118]|uniref:type II toxin-antitoxin system RelE/ParE family toxin n=1 Tax=Asticcacaulis sp. AND118 TaxID=2840468 RepID=UPI001CFFA4DB|nr:type II toxin-antitoxin system RelE/ParE family toxin [Asticcacaulis sp. AND118]UDF02718.1 type II toxin-antitoxin system RelE/ParE family toxin [Asticcacaulis sp. AND118]
MIVAFSAKAIADLEDIAFYIAEDNETRALSFTDEIERKCLSLANLSYRGAMRPNLGQNIRILSHGRYNIYYRVGDEVEILRILHGARQVDEGEI